MIKKYIPTPPTLARSSTETIFNFSCHGPAFADILEHSVLEYSLGYWISLGHLSELHLLFAWGKCSKAAWTLLYCGVLEKVLLGDIFAMERSSVNTQRTPMIRANPNQTAILKKALSESSSPTSAQLRALSEQTNLCVSLSLKSAEFLL